MGDLQLSGIMPSGHIDTAEYERTGRETDDPALARKPTEA